MSGAGRRPLEAPVGTGVLVGMKRCSEPGNGLINHTLRHWLSLTRELDEVPVTNKLRRGAWQADRCRTYVVDKSSLTWSDLQHVPHDPRRVTGDSRWWDAPARVAVGVAHDQGYWPVYLSLVRRAGLPGQQRCSGWTREGSKGRWERWALDTEDGCRVAGDLAAKKQRMRTITAHRSIVVVEKERTYAPDGPLAAIFSHRRKSHK